MSVDTGNRVHVLSDEFVSIYCPACQAEHTVRVSGQYAWQWNKSCIEPTFSPSVLATCGHYTAGHSMNDECWCTYKKNNPEENLPFDCYHCHSFVENGVIRYLDDCSHAYAGKSLSLPPHPSTMEIF